MGELSPFARVSAPPRPTPCDSSTWPPSSCGSTSSPRRLGAGRAVYGRIGQPCPRRRDAVESPPAGERPRPLLVPRLPGALRSAVDRGRRGPAARDPHPPARRFLATFPGGAQLTPPSATRRFSRASNTRMHRNTRMGRGQRLAAEVEAQPGPGLVDRADLGVDPAARQDSSRQRVLGEVGRRPARAAFGDATQTRAVGCGGPGERGPLPPTSGAGDV